VKGLDSNVLLRYLVEDDAVQTRRAAKIIEDAARRKEPLFVSLPVLCEIAWVLDRSYRQSRPAIASALEAILDTEAFIVEQADCARESLHEFQTSKAGFSDHVIGAVARNAGCSWVYTFDRGLDGANGFKIVT